MLQLNPPILLDTPRGPAHAHFVIDRGMGFQFICFMDLGGGCQTFHDSVVVLRALPVQQPLQGQFIPTQLPMNTNNTEAVLEPYTPDHRPPLQVTTDEAGYMAEVMEREGYGILPVLRGGCLRFQVRKITPLYADLAEGPATVGPEVAVALHPYVAVVQADKESQKEPDDEEEIELDVSKIPVPDSVATGHPDLEALERQHRDEQTLVLGGRDGH